MRSRLLEKLFAFSANTSGYEGLKNSGHLSHLDDPETESLLFRYYEMAVRINELERAHNDYLTGLALQFMGYDFAELMFVFREPEFLSEEAFRSMETQSAYNELLTNPIVLAWYESTDLQNLLLAYARLQMLGRSFLERVDSGSSCVGESPFAIALLEPGGNKGFPGILEDGRLNWHSYTIDWSPNSARSHARE